MESLEVLRQGSSGWMVKRMQHLLAAAGAMNEANVANYDGQFGSGTANALNKFKQGAGGNADGTCDSWTWGALMHTIDGIPTIKKGQSGPDVKRMQHLLAACGFMNEANTANYDGQWGNGTENAKINFDNAAGLTPSPPTDCGQKSWTALLTS
jgi:peptidoglycan hydrolase-like protein with peptidoglycan-binding domain